MKHIALLLIRLYRKIISPIKPTCCRMTPSCSAYAYEAFLHRGFFVGLLLTVRRILRCNPFGPVGYDPVPRPIVFKRIDLICKKMRESVPENGGQGVPLTVETVKMKTKRKVASLLPWDGCGSPK